MKRAADFFSADQKGRIESAVQQAESRTSGEIVPMVIDASYDYPRAEILGAGLFSLAAAVTLSWVFFAESLWHFLWLFAVGYLPFKLMIRALPALKRHLIHPDEISAEVSERAVVVFLEQGLHHTRDETGILILISLFEHRVYVLADRGINAVVPTHHWDGIVQTITAGIHAGDTCNALCSAIAACGQQLETHFPVKADDRDELPNLIIEP
ncbi:MAG: TPM domain-containing protein [Desulfuromonadales bacterium]|nr:TPM domain-containing protein [Desulfuromonadales bacterium]